MTKTPKPRSRSTEETMWSSFQTVLSFITLGFFSSSLYQLWTTFVDFWLPNPQNDYLKYSSASSINGPLAGLIVATPLFIGFFYWTNKRYAEEPDLKKAISKKLLNYVTLVITFVILLAQTISAINNALNDTFSLNFGLQILITCLISGTIFLYYLYEVRLEKKIASKKTYALACTVLALVAMATFAAAIPVRASLKENDRNRKPPEMEKYEQMNQENTVTQSPPPR